MKMLPRSPDALELLGARLESLVVGVALFVVVLVLGAFSLRADDAPPPATDPQPATQDTKADQDSGADVEAEFVFKVVSTDGQPVAQASVKPWAVGAQSGSFLLPDSKFPSVKTDAEGMARIQFPKAGDDPAEALLKNLHKNDINELALEVQHPGHPTWSKYIEVGGDRKIVLVDSTTVEIRARGHNNADVSENLYPVLSGPDTDWSLADGRLTVRRVDLASDHPSRWLRIVHVPEKGAAWFSDLIDLKEFTTSTITLDLRLKPGTRVAGRLADDVSRPVKNGRVVAKIIHGADSWSNWNWYATAEIDADGTFAFDALPPDENLQMIAICDGWVSRSPTADDVRDYARQYHWDDSNVEALRSPSFVYPQLHRIEGLASHPVLLMNPTATCEMTVLDENKQPIPNAKVSFWPNQYFFHAGSNVVGDGIDSLTCIREELKSGQKVKPDFTSNRGRYTVTTDAQGKATISNLPAGLAGDAPREEWFVVSRDDYVAIPNSKAPQFGLLSTDPELVANLAPGETERVTIRMKKRPAKSATPAHE